LTILRKTRDINTKKDSINTEKDSINKEIKKINTEKDSINKEKDSINKEIKKINDRIKKIKERENFLYRDSKIETESSSHAGENSEANNIKMEDVIEPISAHGEHSFIFFSSFFASEISFSFFFFFFFFLVNAPFR